MPPPLPYSEGEGEWEREHSNGDKKQSKFKPQSLPYVGSEQLTRNRSAGKMSANKANQIRMESTTSNL